MHPQFLRATSTTRRRTVLLLAIVTFLVFHQVVYVPTYDAWQDLRALSMDEYKWPLEIDTKQVIREYKRGTLDLKPISSDNVTITQNLLNNACKEETTLLTVLIKVRVQDRRNRDLLRRTWIEDLKANHLHHGFLLGQCSSVRCENNLREELLAYNDIIQGDFIDAYYNNTLKFRMGLSYVINHCNTTKYVLIIDGDYSLNVKRLIKYLDEMNYPQNLYAGQLWESARPDRDPILPQYLSYEFYPYRRLPSFIAAGASLMSADIIEPMYIISLYTKYVKFDDVFFGMVAKKLQIPLTNASALLPSYFKPKLEEYEKHRKIIGSHRSGNFAEVELIHHIIHGTSVH